MQKIVGYLFNVGLIVGLSTITFGLISCGGGGGAASSDNGNGSLTITEINPPGIVASSVFQTIVLSGTNFASGVTLTFTGASGTPVVSSVAVTNSMTLTALVKIDTAPTNRYVSVSVQPASSSPAVTHVLGVASVRRNFVTHIYPLLQMNTTGASCTGCHSGVSPPGGLDLNTANYLNNQPSQGCSSRLRVTRGDPRRTSSFLIDKIQATVGSHACFGNPMPNGTQLSPSEIQDFIEWVAGGAY